MIEGSLCSLAPLRFLCDEMFDSLALAQRASNTRKTLTQNVGINLSGA